MSRTQNQPGRTAHRHISPEAIQALLGRLVIGFRPEFAFLGLGTSHGPLGANGGIFLSQSFHWTTHDSDENSYFSKTQHDIFAVTCLNDEEQMTVRREMKKRGYLKEAVFGHELTASNGQKITGPGRLNYQLQMDAIHADLEILVDVFPQWLRTGTATREEAVAKRQTRNAKDRERRRERAEAQRIAAQITDNAERVSDFPGYASEEAQTPENGEMRIRESRKHVTDFPGNTSPEKSERHLIREQKKSSKVKEANLNASTSSNFSTAAIQSATSRRAPHTNTTTGAAPEIPGADETARRDEYTRRDLVNYVSPEDGSALVAAFGADACLGAMDTDSVQTLLDRLNAQRSQNARPRVAEQTPITREQLEAFVLRAYAEAGFSPPGAVKKHMKTFGAEAMRAQLDFAIDRESKKPERERHIAQVLGASFRDKYGPIFEGENGALTGAGAGDEVQEMLQVSREAGRKNKASRAGPASEGAAPPKGAPADDERARREEIWAEADSELRELAEEEARLILDITPTQNHPDLREEAQKFLENYLDVKQRLAAEDEPFEVEFVEAEEEALGSEPGSELKDLLLASLPPTQRADIEAEMERRLGTDAPRGAAQAMRHALLGELVTGQGLPKVQTHDDQRRSA